MDKMIPNWEEIEAEAKTIFGLQSQLIETVKKNQGNQLISEITAQTKALRKPQDKAIKQLLDAIAAATKEYQLNKNATQNPATPTQRQSR